MNRAALQALTWGTISAAVASALLLAAHGDDTEAWGSGRDDDAAHRAAGPGMNANGAPPAEQRAPTEAGRPR